MNGIPASGPAIPRFRSTPAGSMVPRENARHRVLLSLDGGHLTPKVLSSALAGCLQGARRVDVLLVNACKEPTSLLHKLLIGLEQAGIDYRLTCTDGDLGDEVVRYLHRLPGISLVMVASLPTLGRNWDAQVADLRYQGYRFSTLTGLRGAD
jgi:hypothetical protein